MQKTEIKLFSDSNLTALESSVNRFLETLDKDDVVSVVVNSSDHCLKGTYLRASDYCTVYTATVTYRYEYTERQITYELNLLDKQIYDLINKPITSDINAIYLGKYERTLPVKRAWGMSINDVLAKVKESKEYKKLEQEIIDKWWDQDTEWKSKLGIE
jgi:hypothetical protein